MVINIVVIIAFVALAGIQLHVDKKEERRHKKVIQSNKEFKQAIEDFTHAIEKLEITEEQFNSQRRWMRGTMNELRSHGEKLEAHLTQFEDMQQKESYQTSLFKEDE
ncbi:hypothetical protein Sam46_gp57 [Bacillus phage vB_BcM_Sam46]|uniref:Uncharacterized protein n=2 Tax=Caudoviricetes TaxID=2731619 RepID=A0A6G9L6X6_9CAUD|nr:hypothetical protein Sam112_gp54 [Bacillus phage vB_BcM_Sam112]QIQ61258.1 hypothetical protein Sam46_gp57 [Bacillus phage vB_BcM_Sam46]